MKPPEENNRAEATFLDIIKPTTFSSMAIQLPENKHNELRPSTNHPPTVWGYAFASFASQDSELESYHREVELLKKQVKDLFKQSTEKLPDNVEFINSLCRLGVSYHFEDEIEEQLNKIFNSISQIEFDNDDYDLNTLGLLFRILRQHGHKMSCDVFKKFKEGSGEFKKSITSDVKGLLNLYEACFLSVHGEDILDEALVFTSQHLKILAEQSAPHLAKHIRTALFRPSHHAVERIDTLNYLSFYEAEESRNETLLKFAKLDFNRLQLLYRKELAVLSRWWKDLNIMENLPYIRDRIPEGYLWALGTLFEPQYNICRREYTKHLQLLTVLDDIYDEYGTFDELSRFTAALQSFTTDGGNDLPEYMAFFYQALLICFGEKDEDGSKEFSYKIHFAREMFIELARAYMVEAEWLNDGYVATFDEYMSRVGVYTSTFDILFSAMVLGVENMGMRDILWVRENPRAVNICKLFGRLWNDVSTREGEIKGEGSVSSVVCYMKQYGVSKEKTIQVIDKMLEDGWKDLNEDLMKMKSSNTPKLYRKFCLNYSRLTDFTYRGDFDLFTCGSDTKSFIDALFVHPLPI